MHPSSIENMRKCYNRYAAGIEASDGVVVVLDVGAADVNGSYRSVFAEKKFRYLAADLEAGRGIDVVLTDSYSLPLADGSIDVVVSGQAFEHIEFFWQTFSEMVRVLKRDGFIFLIAPSAGPEHRYPVDCYRFYPDAFRALAKFAHCDLIDVWRDERGPWRDLVGVFRHSDAKPMEQTRTRHTVVSPWTGPPGSPEEEQTRGSVGYLEVLSRLHQVLRPQAYLEIGVRHGVSLALAKCRAIGVDPAPELTVTLPATTQVITCDSDAFFEKKDIGLRPDLSFIDGMHQFEFALRDFMNIERLAVPGSAVVIDDILPNHAVQADRLRRTHIWCGDIWKLVEILRRFRPDLYITCLDAKPTGLALIAGLDPNNRVLWNDYNPIVRRFSEIEHPPQDVLERNDALDPLGQRFEAVLHALGEAYRRRERPTDVVKRLREAERLGSGRSIKLSVIVVGFNMQRELPRTVRSLSPQMQQGVESDDYEIIVVDNGSASAVEEAELRRLAPNVRVLRVPEPTASPVPAIQIGLKSASGELVGVFIDGARMASPGMLANAMAASKLGERAVVGTIAFHLGPKNQMQSLREGYDQATEDALLARSGWEKDGYKLFEISSLAGSSAGGWFAMPAESNAVFMRASHWRELGGYDASFVSPGGGLANHDLWARACADPRAKVIMLLGEATFHQTHGGVATASDAQQWEARLKAFREEYARIRGRQYERPDKRLYYFGTSPEHTKARREMSAQM